MIKNYFKIAWRNLIRQKGYTIINLLGLAIGLTSCLLISYYVIDELSYDKYHKKGDRIYRIVTNYTSPSGDRVPFALGPYRMKKAFESHFTQVEEFVRITDYYEMRVQHEERIFQENRVSMVDPNFFEVFTLNWIAGNPQEALKEPFTVVINRSTAEKYFGTTDVVNESIKFLTSRGNTDMRITGVVEDMPDNSHFHIDIFGSLETAKYVFNERELKNWGELTVFSYILLPPEVPISNIENETKEFIAKTFGEEGIDERMYEYQPLYDIHLNSNTRIEFEQNGSFTNVIIFSLIALFILLIASVNYMNMATARSIKRSKEVGIRKVVGARREQLVFQFITEAILLVLVGIWLAIIISDLLLPYFNQLSGKQLEIKYLNNWWLLIILFLIPVVVGVLAGIYPAFYLSSFKPVRVLYGTRKITSSNAPLRKTLVVSQFSISIALIIATLIVYHQWSYMSNKKLGIDPTNVVILHHPGDKYKAFKQELLKSPNILNVTASNKRPTERLGSNLEYNAEGLEPDKERSIKIVTVEYDFFVTLDNEIVKGRSFNKKFGNDENATFILNQKAVEEIGWENPIGKWFETSTIDPETNNWKKRKGTIVGVAEDFHFESLHNKIEPVVFFIDHNWINWMSIKISSENIPKTMRYIKSVWDDLEIDGTYDPAFYEEELDALYRAERRFFRIFIIFAILAIVIACLGIYGLASFTAEQRTKEMGIRKAFGANTSKVMALINREFIKLVIIANIIAWPVTWYFMDQWLQNYPYRVNLHVWIFLAGGLLALFIAQLSVSYQSYRAATTNPASSLRYE